MRALITGITGQDGSYLAELLLNKGYEVHGLVRPSTLVDQTWIAPLCVDTGVYDKRLFLHRGDLSDARSLEQLVSWTEPNELYHLAGQTHVGASFQRPAETCELIGLATVRLLELVRRQKSPAKFFFASSSEIFGQPSEVPQNELTPISPISPYGCAKAFATQLVAVYRHSCGLFACSGILFNHESPRRGLDFVTRKICRGAAAIKLGIESQLCLGNTAAQRDWGWARDYVEGMWLTLQHARPEDFVFATGELHLVQDIVEIAFETVALDWRKHLRHDPDFARPTESRRLVGDAAKAKQLLGWEPKISFRELIVEMTRTELSRLDLGRDKRRMGISA